MFQILKRPNLVNPSRVAVSTEGERVVLEINNTRMVMRYEDAITLSQWLRVNGKKAKKAAGDASRHWSLVAFAGGAPEK